MPIDKKLIFFIKSDWGMVALGLLIQLTNSWQNYGFVLYVL